MVSLLIIVDDLERHWDIPEATAVGTGAFSADIAQIKLIFLDMFPLGWLGLYYGTLSASTALRFTQLLHPHEVTTSLLSISAQNRLSLPKSLPWGSLFALDDPITVINNGALNAS